MAVITSSSMIFQLFLIMGQQAASADTVLDRYAAAHKVLPTFEAKAVAQVNDTPPVQCLIRSQGAEQVLFRLTLEKASYVVQIRNGMSLELDSPSKIYDERPFPDFRGIASRISRASIYFPDWLGTQDLKRTFDSKWSLKDPETISGALCDRIFNKAGNKDSGIEVEASIDALGMPRRMTVTRFSRGNSLKRTWTLTSLSMRKAFQASALTVTVPNGYSPYALDYTPAELHAGQSFPFQGWVDKSGRTADLKPGKVQIVAVIGEDSEPNTQVIPFLKSLGLPLTLVAEDNASTISGAIFDTAGMLRKKLDPQGTPTIYLLDASGVVKAIWMGFDLERAAELSRDIKAAAAGGE